MASASPGRDRSPAFLAIALGCLIGVPNGAVLLASTSQTSEQPAMQTGADTSQLVREGSRLTLQDVEGLEKELKATPDDLPARARLLGFYFASALRQLGPEATIEARRRHILWLIDNHPEWQLAGTPQATIDPKGHPLADGVGYAGARDAWLRQVESQKNIRSVIANAFWFFKLTDKESAEAVAKRGQALEPAQRDWPARLGWLYALGILGVTGMNQNGLCTDADPEAAKGPFAVKARKELETSSNAVVLGMAGRTLTNCGTILSSVHKTTPGLDPSDRTKLQENFALAERLLQNAHAREPQDGIWVSDLASLYKLRVIMSTSPDEKASLRKKVFVLLEEMDNSRPKTQRQLSQLTKLTNAAFEAAEYRKAETYANDLLLLASQHQRDSKYVDYVLATHSASIVLGRIALRNGDVDAAKADLLKAGKIKGDAGPLFAFAPSMALAKELLERGEKQTVIDYLELCKGFWEMGKKQLQEWIDTIRSGGTPQFSLETGSV